MKAKLLFKVSLVTLLVVAAVISGGSTARGTQDSPAVVYVDPLMNSAPVGHYFTVNINVANVTNLNGWSLTLYFNKAVLYTNSTMIMEGPFLSQNGTYPTVFTKKLEVGWWRVGSYITTPGIGVSGSGTLANVTFLVQKEGWSAISLLTTSLGDPNLIQIPHTSRDGFFSNIRDVAVWDVIAEPTTVSVGGAVFINVTVSNQGNETETFDVTANYDNTTIGSQSVTSLDPGTFETLTIIWNTTGVADGTYTLSANASILQGEIDTDNNRLVDGNVTLTLAPAAIFSFSPADPLVGENVTFDATASFDPDGYIANFTWDFGDDSIDTMNKTIVYHAYTSAGYYTVNLTVTDNNNLTDTQLKSIAVGKPNASFTFTPDSPIIGQTVTFNASLSTPKGGATIANYTWDFDDGNRTTATDPVIGHIYTLPGTYTVTLNVTDSEGMWDTESKPITVGPPVPPVATFTFAPESPLMQETVTFNAAESTPNGGTIVSYEWDFGDGNTTTVSEPIIAHAYESAGTYTVILKVTDSEGQWDTEIKLIAVKTGPEASFSFSPTTPVVNDIVTFNATASGDSDGTIVSYEWDFGDGNTTTVTEPTITHAYADSGDYTVTLTVTDNDGLTDTETESIEVQGAPSDIIIYLVAAIVIIVIAAVIVVYFVRTRKPS